MPTLPFASAVILYHDIPLDPMYEHTLLFSSKSAQDSYFASMQLSAVGNFTSLSYIRHQGGVIRVESKMSLLTNCNYIKFANPTSYEDVDFYCFVDNIRYINENTIEIAYTVDVMQTWMFYYELNACYVERENVRDDSVGANRVTEGLDTGEYVCPAIERIDHWDSVYSTESADVIQNTTFVVIATQAPDGSQSSYQFNGVASSMYIAFAYNTTGLQNILDSFINGVTQSLEPIISIGMFPSYFKPNATSPIIPKLSTLSLDQSIGFGGFTAYDPESVDYKTYIPKNNKLYQYPYNFMVFESPDGSTIELKFENFKNNNSHQFVTWLSILPDMETMCAPKDYEGSYGASLNQNMHYALYSKGYPYCAVASDAFSAWWAQNRYSMPVAGAIMAAKGEISVPAKQDTGSNLSGKFSGGESYLNREYMAQLEAYRAKSPSYQAQNNALNYLQNQGLSATLIAGGSVGNLAGDILGGNFGSIGNAAVSIGMDLAAIEGHRAVPDTLVTKANNGGVNHYMEMDCYKIHYIKIRPEYAEIIDNYFSCYGYAIHRVKVPDITSRTRWNYIKTKGCTLKRNSITNRYLPMEAERAITAIYNKGITFWHDPSHIHDYTDGYGNLYSNPIVT